MNAAPAEGPRFSILRGPRRACTAPASRLYALCVPLSSPFISARIRLNSRPTWRRGVPGLRGGNVEHGEGRPTFEEIYGAYADRVLNLAYRITADEETARDLTQEIFVKVYENLGDFEQRSHVFTWIYRIAINHITSYLRKERRRRWVFFMDQKLSDVLREGEEQPAFAVPAIESSAERKLEEQERARIVWSIIRSLPPKYRVPLVLFYYDGMSHKEISDTLGLSVAAVETRIHRAKKQLIKKLEPWLGRI